MQTNYDITDESYSEDFQTFTLELNGKRTIDVPTTEFTGGLEVDSDGNYTEYDPGQAYMTWHGVEQDDDVEIYRDVRQTITDMDEIELIAIALRWAGEQSGQEWTVVGRERADDHRIRSTKIKAATWSDLAWLIADWAYVAQVTDGTAVEPLAQAA